MHVFRRACCTRSLLTVAVMVFMQERRTIFICGMLRTKDVHGFLRPLLRAGATLYALSIPSEGGMALTAQEILSAAKLVGFTAYEANSPMEAIHTALAKSPAPTEHRKLRFVICGSLYLAGWVLRDNRTCDRTVTHPPNGAFGAQPSGKL